MSLIEMVGDVVDESIELPPTIVGDKKRWPLPIGPPDRPDPPSPVTAHRPGGLEEICHLSPNRSHARR
jgi:hypothetical protein